MIRRLLLVTICMASFLTLHAQVEINETNFPDAKFREQMQSYSYDVNSDGFLSDEEISDITNLSLYGREISSLQGIEYLINLEYLHCNTLGIKEFNLSGLLNLKELEWLYNDQIDSLDLSGLQNLESLICSSNQLTSLDLSKNVNLKKLDLSLERDLLYLNISNTSLEEFYFDDDRVF